MLTPRSQPNSLQQLNAAVLLQHRLPAFESLDKKRSEKRCSLPALFVDQPRCRRQVCRHRHLPDRLNSLHKVSMSIPAIGLSRMLRCRAVSLPANTCCSSGNTFSDNLFNKNGCKVKQFDDLPAGLRSHRATSSAHLLLYTKRRNSLSSSSSSSLSGCGIKKPIKSTDFIAPDGPPTLPSQVKGFDAIQLLALVCIFTIQFAYNTFLSVLPPFFPPNAEKNGLNEFQCSLVFSISPTVSVCVTPFFGQFLSRFGPKPLLVLGLGLNGAAVMAFGIVDHLPTANLYLISCLLFRTIEALGTCLHCTAVYMYIMQTFSQRVGFVFGLYETSIGFGLSFGPIVGGFMMHYGGYKFTFCALATFILLCIPLSMCAIVSSPPRPNESDWDETVKEQQLNDSSGSESDSIGFRNSCLGKPTPTYLQLLRHRQLRCIALLAVLMSSSQTFVDPVLESHLQQFKLTPRMVGFVFFLFSSAFSVSSPLVGVLSVNRSTCYQMMACGVLISGVGFSLLGPSVLLPFLTPSLVLTTIGLVCLGFGIGCAYAPTFQALLDCAIESGYQNVGSTHAKVAALAHTLLSIGEAIGPAACGLLSRWFDFAETTSMMAIVCTLMIPLLLVRRKQLGQSYSLKSGDYWSLFGGKAHEFQHKHLLFSLLQVLSFSNHRHPQQSNV